MKKLIAVFSVIAVLISCAGIVSFALGESGKTAELSKDGQALYSVTYSGFWTQISESRKSLLQSFRTTLSRITGAEFELYTGEEKLNEKEIFIGNTTTLLMKHRTRVAEGGLYEVDEDILGKNGFVITTSGDRYILAASNSEGATNAVMYFIEELAGYDLLDPHELPSGTLTVPAEVRVIKSEYLDCDVDVAVDIAGTDIGEYSIVYPEYREDDGDIPEEALTLARHIFAMTGKTLRIVNDSEEAGKYEIVIGKTGRRDFSGLGENETAVLCDGGKLYLCGGSERTTETALGYFEKEIFGIVSGKYTGGSAVHIPDGLDLSGEEDLWYFKASGVDGTDYIRDNIGRYLGSGTPCFSDTSAADRIADAVLEEGHKSGDEVFVVCNRADWCGCEKCAGKADAFFETLNAVARRLSDNGIRVSTVAENETRRPPAFKMENNVRVYFTEPSVCCAHALDDANCEVNRSVEEDISSWLEACSDLYILDYSMNYKYYPSTFPNLDVIRPNISFYHNAGARGVLMVWQKGTAELELGALREKLIGAVLSDPEMSPESFDLLKDEIISELYGYSADALRKYITEFRDASAEHFTVFSKPSEILPVNRTADGAYDLTQAKKFANLWESVYRRHASPDPAYMGMEMTAFEKAYLNSDYYLPLHSRVQFIEWINGNIEQKDRNAVFSEIAASYEK